MLFAMAAWVIRYGFFALGDSSMGWMLIIISNIVYGMAFDFFNISGSMFIETNTDHPIRSSAQGLFMMMTNGFGAYIGTIASSWVIDTYFILPDGQTDWSGAWAVFSAYSFVVMIFFLVLFRHKHNPEDLSQISH